MAQTRHALDQAITAGFRKDMIAVVSFRGREGSALGAFDQVGGHRLRKFTGGYDAGGSPVYSEGDLLLDSVYRFKGRSAPCVILTEIDFEALGEIEMRKIFVGATRATMKLFLVMSEGAAGVMVGRLEERDRGLL
ncbi:MAG: ATP-binding domain-containing protein [Betaproteobacteria bacterium]|nr:ATP-binding domain-containing protein [Betaproteobacteria bacterium]